MKNKIYLLITFLLGSIFLVNINAVFAFENDTFYLQPATEIAYDENVRIHRDLTVVGTASFLSSTYIKGVVFFNGTIVNSTTASGLVGEAEVNNPVTIGDSLRVDDTIFRLERGGEHPLKIEDHLVAAGNFDLGTESNPWRNIYADSLEVNSLQTNNFSADLLDGQDGNYYTNLSNASIDNQSKGDVLYFNGSNWQRLAAGNAGQYLQTQGVNNNPQWATVTTSGGASYLADLADINTSTATNGNILMADGTDWESVAQTQITKLGTITSGNVDSIVNKSSVGLGSVENTALSTWAGSANITTVGTISSGTWEGTAIADGQISSAATWNAKQTGHAYLTDIAGITASQGDIIYFNDAGNWVNLAPGISGQFLKTQGVAANPIWDNIAGGGDMLASNNLSDLDDASTSRTNLGVEIGTNVQAYDADLTTYAGITPSADIQGLLGSADYATARTNLGLGNVENTALSTWVGTSNVTTVGTISSGTWEGTAVDDAHVADDITASNYLAIANNLSDLNDANAARTNLGLAIGTNVQAYDADLTTYAGITPSANVQSLLGAADYAAARALLDLEAGTDFNAYDADLTTYAGITPSADIQGLLGSADYATARTNLGITASVAKENVRVATTETGVLATVFENLDTIDDIVLATGDRILIKNQSSGEENGIYTVNASGAPTRATDFDADSDISGGVTVFIEEGTANGGESWVLTNTGAIVLDTTALTFSQYDQSAVTPTSLGLVIGTNVQAYDPDLTTYAGITPSANIQTLLGSADYSAARTNLSLVPGTNVQAYDADLTTYAGITPSANIQSLLGSADYAVARALLDLEAGTDFNTYDPDLADIAGITTNQGDIIYFNGSNWVDLAPGTNGHYLQTQGAGANPQWAAVAGGSGDITAVGDVDTGAAFTATAGDDGNSLYFEGSSVDENELQLTASDPGSDLTLTLPAATDTLVGKATTDTLTNKTLTSPVLDTAPTAVGATWTNLGSVTTVDINGGTIDATTIGATTPAAGTFANLQSGYNGADGQLTVYSEQGGTDYSVIFQPNAAMTETTTYTLPTDNGDASEVLTTDGAGALSWAAAGGGSTAWTTSGSDVILNTITDNVGIGVASPASKLEVEQAYAGGATPRTWLYIDADINTGNQSDDIHGITVNIDSNSQQVTGVGKEAVGVNVDVSNVEDDGSAETYSGKFVGGNFLLQSGEGQSYANTRGSGDRQSLIAESESAGLFQSGSTTYLIDGSYNSSSYFFNTLPVAGEYMKFDFGEGRIITEALWSQSSADSQGTWKWQGSNNDIDWTDIGSSFTLANTIYNNDNFHYEQTMTELNGNSTSYRYYRLLGVSGNTNWNAYFMEIEFEIDGSAILLEADSTNMELSSPVTYSNAVGAINRSLAIDSTGVIGYMSSSERYKENIVDMQDTDWIYDLRPVNFTYIEDETKSLQYGLIAEEVEGVNPKFVSYNEKGQPETVSYEKLITPVISEVQDLKKENEELEERVRKLEEKIDNLK